MPLECWKGMEVDYTTKATYVQKCLQLGSGETKMNLRNFPSGSRKSKERVECGDSQAASLIEGHQTQVVDLCV